MNYNEILKKSIVIYVWLHSHAQLVWLHASLDTPASIIALNKSEAVLVHCVVAGLFLFYRYERSYNANQTIDGALERIFAQRTESG